MAKAKKAARKKATAKKKPAAARAAKKTTAARTKKKPAAKRTSQGKFVIEGVPPLEVGLSALSALASALETMGADISYEMLLVASGEAFRLYVQTGRPQSSGRAGRSLAGVAVEANTFATENLVERACQALGVQAEAVALEAKPSATRLKAIWKVIEKQVRWGVPVPACGCRGSFQHEWCLITGLDPERRRVFFRDMTHRFELYGHGPAGNAWKGWMPGPDGEVWVPHVLIKAVRKGRTTEGRNARSTSSFRILAKSMWRITFSPPPVLPAQPPTNIRNIRIPSEKLHHRSKLSVQNPVVVMIETTWNSPKRKAVSSGSPSAFSLCVPWARFWAAFIPLCSPKSLLYRPKPILEPKNLDSNASGIN